MKDGLLTVIIPAYNEHLMVKKAFIEINKILSDAKIEHNFIFVDDGSSDYTWEDIKNLSQENVGVVGVHFSRNFGKEAAISAGLNAAKDSSCVVTIDCDLQHPPTIIPTMYKLWQEGYEVVEGIKHSRGKENAVKRMATAMFYNIISDSTKIDMRKASDFKLLDKKAVNSIVSLREKGAFFRALSSWVGYKTTSVEFDVQEREAGSSKWSIKSLIKYAISNITSFSSAPMQVVTCLGFITFIVTLVIGMISLIQKITGRALEGFTTVIILLLFIGSVIMISLGIIGYYLSKIYEEVKDRPTYIVSEKCGVE